MGDSDPVRRNIQNLHVRTVLETRATKPRNLTCGVTPVAPQGCLRRRVRLDATVRQRIPGDRHASPTAISAPLPEVPERSLICAARVSGARPPRLETRHWDHRCPRHSGASRPLSGWGVDGCAIDCDLSRIRHPQASRRAVARRGASSGCGVSIAFHVGMTGTSDSRRMRSSGRPSTNLVRRNIVWPEPTAGWCTSDERL